MLFGTSGVDHKFHIIAFIMTSSEDHHAHASAFRATVREIERVVHDRSTRGIPV